MERTEIIVKLIKLKFQNNLIDKFTITVASESMFPKYNCGEKVDVFPIEQELKKGDIILYSHWNKSLTLHRIVDIYRTKSKLIYRTKGDNNPDIDPYELTDDNIIGVIRQ